MTNTTPQEKPENIKVPLKRGPKPKFDPSMCEKVIEVAARGGHIPAICVELGICKETYYTWKDRYPEFREAVAYAELVSQAVWEELGFKGATGQIPNFNASTYALIMNNKFKHDYIRSSSGSSGNTEITINSINMTPEEMNKRINETIQRLKAKGFDLFNSEDAIDAEYLEYKPEDGSTE